MEYKFVAVQIENTVTQAVHKITINGTRGYHQVRSFQGFWNAMLPKTDLLSARAKEVQRQRRLRQHFWIMHPDEWESQLAYEQRIMEKANKPKPWVWTNAPVIEHSGVQEFFKHIGYSPVGKSLVAWREIAVPSVWVKPIEQQNI
jgi:hypothetical protein